MRQCGDVILACTQGLCQGVLLLFQYLFCWWRNSSNKVSAACTTRRIEVGVVDADNRKKHNKIKTTKYTLLNFVPKNLSEQFRRVANFYFLIVTVISIVIDSPVSPMTSIAPLSFMVLVTAAKQGYEDWLRHKEDNKVNNQVVDVVHKGVIKQVRNALIAPGTLVRVRRGREVPADLVLLCSASEKGKCYVTTANLDGEANLKTLRVPPPLVGYTPDILPQGMLIEVPNPVADLYTFYGRFDVAGLDTVVLTPDNLMLRGSRVRNTEWAIGCAVYTGEETKLALNSKYTGNKFSSCELATNTLLLVFMVVLVAEIAASMLAKTFLERRDRLGLESYLGPVLSGFPPPLGDLAQDMGSFLLLYYYIIPMSLYVTIELNKFLGTYFIGWDAELRCEETGRPAVANTSDLNEDLGQVEVLFSDKTGTLTKNQMVFKACSVRGRVLEERGSALYDTQRPAHPVDVNDMDVRWFFTILALCHTVQISSEDQKRLSARLSGSGGLRPLFRLKKRSAKANGNGNANGAANAIDDATWNALLGDTGSTMEYQGSSPDEKALVEAADRVGVKFLGEDGNNLMLKVGERTELYERLQLVEFTSERKRMSVILRDKDGRIWLFCKGAESSIFPICKDSALIEETNRDLTAFSNKGLRTLAVGYREISDEEYNRVAESIKRIDIGDAESLQQITQQYRVLEQELTLAGATAVEDCLQDDVASTLHALRRAGIVVWVLTGDKVETAINVSQSCAHMSPDDRRLWLAGCAGAAGAAQALEECARLASQPSPRPLSLVTDGATMELVLDQPAAAAFAALALRCHAVLCCRLSPIQKAQIVRLIKNSKDRPVTAAIGDGANDISMIQEAHVGFGIFGREGYQAARSADFAFTKFSMMKKILLVMGHWYYQRLTTLIHYFFYKNLVLGNIMFFFQIQSSFSTQSVYDSLFLTVYNLVLTSVPVLALSFTEQCWPQDTLLRNPMLYREIRKNKLMSWSQFSAWCVSATYHSVVIYVVCLHQFRVPVLSRDAKTVDLWSFGAMLFHLNVVVVTLKLWLHTRYHTLLFVLSALLSVLANVAINAVYASIDSNYDGDVLGTYTRLLASPSFWFANLLTVAACFAPDLILRLAAARRHSHSLRHGHSHDEPFTTRL